MGTFLRSGAATLTLTLVCTTVAAADGPRTRNVLALYWYGRDTAANVMFDRGLQSTLQADQSGPVNRFAEYLEAEIGFRVSRRPVRSPTTSWPSTLGVTIDVLVAESEQALKFLIDQRPTLFGNVPIVYFSFRVPDLPVDSLSPGSTGVVVAGAAARTLDLALKLHPAATRALVIAGGPDNRGQALETSLRRELEPFARQVALVELP